MYMVHWCLNYMVHWCLNAEPPASAGHFPARPSACCQCGCGIMIAVNAISRAGVLVLAIAVATTPVVLDGCWMACQAATGTANGAAAKSEHACHRPSDTGPLRTVDNETRPCSHGDGLSVSSVVEPTKISSPLRTSSASLAVAGVKSVARCVVAAFASSSPISPPGIDAASSSALPLRI
jgi:hypothetical protein